jgi:hypothetical protein
VRPKGIVVAPPGFDYHSGFREAEEQRAILARVFGTVQFNDLPKIRDGILDETSALG